MYVCICMCTHICVYVHIYIYIYIYIYGFPQTPRAASRDTPSLHHARSVPASGLPDCPTWVPGLALVHVISLSSRSKITG